MYWGDKRLPDRFWHRAKPVAEHWLWTGPVWVNGYGRFKMGGIDYRVHRLIYSLAVKVPEFQILHRCNIKICFQPNCLYEGTHPDNMDDRRAQDRQAKGEDTGNAKITEDDVREIRRLYKEGPMTQAEIATQFGINQSNVSHIVLRRAWDHVK